MPAEPLGRGGLEPAGRDPRVGLLSKVRPMVCNGLNVSVFGAQEVSVTDCWGTILSEGKHMFLFREIWPIDIALPKYALTAHASI